MTVIFAKLAFAGLRRRKLQGALTLLVVAVATAALTVALGIGFAAGFLLAHALPFGPGSYWAYEPGALSWALVILPMLVGLAAVGVGRRALRAS